MVKLNKKFYVLEEKQMTKAEKRKLKNKNQGIIDFIKVVKYFFN